MAEMKKRSPALAFFLSLLWPGLGQLYNGRLEKGIGLYLASQAVYYGLLFIGLARSFTGLVIWLCISFGFLLAIAIEAFVYARRIKEVQAQRYHRWYVYLAYIFITVFLYNLMFGLKPIKSFAVFSESMRPTLKIGDLLMADLRAYDQKAPRRGDLVTFESPGDTASPHLKRVVGLPGEKIEIRDGVVHINGGPQPLTRVGDYQAPPGPAAAEYRGCMIYEEELIQGPDRIKHQVIRCPAEKIPENFNPITIPEGAYFLLGDNRSRSVDSRHFGPVKKEKLLGKPLYLYWSRHRERIGKKL